MKEIFLRKTSIVLCIISHAKLRHPHDSINQGIKCPWILQIYLLSVGPERKNGRESWSDMIFQWFLHNISIFFWIFQDLIPIFCQNRRHITYHQDEFKPKPSIKFQVFISFVFPKTKQNINKNTRGQKCKNK